MAYHDPDENITMKTSHTEDEWYRVGMASYERLRSLKHSAIVIPEALRNLVRVRQGGEEGMVVRIVRGGSPKAHARLH